MTLFCGREQFPLALAVLIVFHPPHSPSEDVLLFIRYFPPPAFLFARFFFFFVTGDNYFWAIRIHRFPPSTLLLTLEKASGKPWQFSGSKLLSWPRTASSLKEFAYFLWAFYIPCHLAGLQIGELWMSFLNICILIFTSTMHSFGEEVWGKSSKLWTLCPYFPLIAIFQRL